VETGCVDELNLILAGFGFLVGQHPNIRADASAEEDIGRQGDNGLDVVIFQQPAADLAFALAGVADEQWRTGQDDGGATPTASTNFPPMYPNIGICCFFSSHMNCGRGMQQNNLDRAGLRG
jgi:hypothetical protein